MTYSIVAREAAGGELGVAVQTHNFAVGTVVSWAEAGVGAVATQSLSETSYGPLGLELLRTRMAPEAALRGLLAADEDREVRQVAMVDVTGRTAVHTGARCIAVAGHRTGDGVSVQANMMRGEGVPEAMLAAYEATAGELAVRLLAALDAAEAAGGDVRGRESAALLVVRAEASGKPWDDRLVDVRVDDAPEPLAELRRLVDLRRAWAAAGRAGEALARGDHDAAARERQACLALAAGHVEPAFWHALELAQAGRDAEARPLLDRAFAQHDGWAEVVRRLPAAGLLPDDAELLRRILGR